VKLTIQRLCASYGKTQVLQNVSFTAPDGKITALIGRNGVGKSTLVRCLMGEKQDYHGKICLGEQDVKVLSLSERARQLACLPQTLPHPHVTVEELVAYGRAPYTSLWGSLSEQDKEAAAKALQAVGLSKLKDRFVDELSGGERKKAFFAMTLAQDTPIVILDEPTAHLDAASRFSFLSMLDDLRHKSDKTFLVIMHDLTDVLRCADKIVVLHEGQIVFDGTAEQCLLEEIPQQYFGIRISGNPTDGFAAMPK